MTKKTLVVVMLLAGAFAIAQGVKFYRANLASIPTAILPPKQDIAAAINTTGFPLKLPDGFSISLFAKDLENPRVLAFDPKGRLLVSLPSSGRVVALVDWNDDGVRDASEQITVVEGLRRPHGLALGLKESYIDGKYLADLYIAETNQISLFAYDIDTFKATNKRKILDLPSGGNHFTRTIGFGPDERLYVSIGSSCNVCIEKDSQRATILSLNPDGTDVKTFASGLRNSVFFTWNPLTNKLWATEMGRDLLGDDTPPDEINIVEERNNYGWPDCYGKNMYDTNFNNVEAEVSDTLCQNLGKIPSHIDLPAHSAPLGLAFIPESTNWPKEYWGDLLVSYHGSWNRSVPAGYKVVRIKLDETGNAMGMEDFITGWLQGKESLGRPVDLLFDWENNLYISDDKAGMIYLVRYST